MATGRQSKRTKPSLNDRFNFDGGVVAPGDRQALRSAMFEVEDRISGQDRCLKLWKKTGTPVDEDLRQLWLHEMRQVQRVMSYAGARDVIVDVIEFVEDEEDFGVVLERVGQPLDEKRKRVARPHWLRNLNGPRPRILFWKNIARIVVALGIIHKQSLVHGRIGADVVMTEGLEEPDFQLGGFEWSLWLSSDLAEKSQAKLGPAAALKRADRYSFADDWRDLGLMIADCLDTVIQKTGEVYPKEGALIALDVPERALLRRLVTPARMDHLDADSIARSIDDLIASVSRASSARAGTFILGFSGQAKLGDAVYAQTSGAIPVDEYRRQLDWVRADLDQGATLLVPRVFDPGTSSLRLITNTMIYRMRAFRDEGAPVWDIAVCYSAEMRNDIFSLGDHDEHSIVQTITIAGTSRQAQELRGRLGPDVLDWTSFSHPTTDSGPDPESVAIRRALLLVQTIEAVTKALDVYPIDVLDTGRREGRRFAILRAAPASDRDKIAKRINLSEGAAALKRLFEDEHRDADSKWRISQAASLGASRNNDVTASFVEVVDHHGIRGYQFEIDEELTLDGQLFLRTERDTGTEQVIGRRLRNIKALDTRVDLTEMLADPWRVRHANRETLSEEEQNDSYFLDLDKPKRKALAGLWTTLPSFFVVGPPGVGKTKLATEVVRRRFASDGSTRMLVSAQGHDALDNLQEKIKETLSEAKLPDVLVIRSTTPEKRTTSDEEVHKAGLEYLERLADSDVIDTLPLSIQTRIKTLRQAATRLERSKDMVSRQERSGLGAISHLVLDAANIVISTANSPDIERLVEAREQFDWVIVEEAAKATGPELIGPLMLSGRRLLIGDHFQLPPFEADRLVKILSDHSLVVEALGLAEQLVGPLMHDGELDELEPVKSDPTMLRDIAAMALRVLEPFRAVVEEDERRTIANPNHRPLAETLTEQRRMDPAIAEVVSKAFYRGRLDTECGRKKEAETKPSPVSHLGPLPNSPIVAVDFPHVSSTSHGAGAERGKPRWHNPAEVGAVMDILRLLRPNSSSKKPTLAILSPYKAQVDKLQDALTGLRSTSLSHLDGFLPVRSNSAFVGTVDSFQGSEADVVILSLVRNSARTGAGALGFLRDKRRMNVALSRAKRHLFIVGSLDFLREAVRGVNPDAAEHDLSFLTTMVDTIADLTTHKRGELLLATIVAASKLKGSK
jgi:hypothetical protein